MRDFFHNYDPVYFVSNIDGDFVNGFDGRAEGDVLNETLDENAKNLIHEFWYGHAIKRIPAKAVQRLKEFWPHLIEAILQSNNPQVALVRLMPLVESVMRRTVYLVMLIESKGALQRLVKM